MQTSINIMPSQGGVGNNIPQSVNDGVVQWGGAGGVAGVPQSSNPADGVEDAAAHSRDGAPRAGERKAPSPEEGGIVQWGHT